MIVQQPGIIGFHVDTADDGREALHLLSRPVGLVLTDLDMSVIDRFELACALRRHEAAACLLRTPIVALSANVMPVRRERASHESSLAPASTPGVL